MLNIFEQAVNTVHTYAAIKHINRKSTLEVSDRFLLTCKEISDFARKNDVEQCFFSVNPETCSLVIQMHMFEMYAKRGRTDLFFNIIRETSEFVFRKIDGETICLELSFPFQWI